MCLNAQGEQEVRPRKTAESSFFKSQCILINDDKNMRGFQATPHRSRRNSCVSSDVANNSLTTGKKIKYGEEMRRGTKFTLDFYHS